MRFKMYKEIEIVIIIRQEKIAKIGKHGGQKFMQKLMNSKK